ncbi:MAG TPA: substrate-binding domain-containing protein [Flavobacterium sp.]|nr:substrate-binding domain-containing protein [Flavobacterium sp.]
MGKYVKQFLVILVIVFAVARCKKETDHQKESILKGKVSILVDETLTPVIEDQIAVFESEYDANITLISKSEAETVNALMNDSVKIAILSRTLTPEEINAFDNKKINPRITPFATDAIALIRNKDNKDILVALNDVLEFMRGKTILGIKGLVFDNPNSSTMRYLTELAGLKASPQQGIFSFHNNNEAIKYVAENDGMIGVVGLNWIVQPLPEMQPIIKNISILNLKGLKSDGYYSPTQNNIAEGKYPLARDLFIVNCQGFDGLGMGFASFIAGERGQRIILKSGLLPVRVRGRKIVIRNKINK